MNDTLAVILGGGRGTGLFPLTLERSEPAVPVAGKYRLIDVPVSNCLNSDLRRIFVLTQYKSESLHKHIGLTYKFDVFSGAFVSVLAAEQTEESADWFQGTADAVRQVRRHLAAHGGRDVLVLSGDQLYQMDFRRLAETHRRSGADATLAVTPVARDRTAGLGILRVDGAGRVVHFEEKPGAHRLDELESEIPGRGRGFLASMGIYLYRREALERALEDGRLVDFGRDVLPRAIGSMNVQAHLFEGYWEDVGTIASYFEASLRLTAPLPPFEFFDADRPVYTHARFLPATKFEGCTLREAVVCEGCILMGAEIERSVIGIRSRIGQGARLRETLVLGADEYESVAEIERAEARGLPPLGIGAGSVLERCIVDKDARIGRGVRILAEGRRREADGDGWFIRDGIVVVPKGGVVRDGAVI